MKRQGWQAIEILFNREFLFADFCGFDSVCVCVCARAHDTFCACMCVHHILRHVSFMFIKIDIKYMGIEAFMVISIQIMVFWFVILCSLFEMGYQCFGGT